MHESRRSSRGEFHFDLFKSFLLIDCDNFSPGLLTFPSASAWMRSEHTNGPYCPAVQWPEETSMKDWNGWSKTRRTGYSCTSHVTDSTLRFLRLLSWPYVRSIRRIHNIREDALRPEHRAQKRKKRGFFFPLFSEIGKWEIRDRTGISRKPRSSERNHREKKDVWILISRGRKGLVEDRLNVLPSNDMYPLWCCTCAYKYKYAGSPYI